MDQCIDYTFKLYSNPNVVELMIEVKNLHKSFSGVEVLKGISTSFEKGKTNLIIGQSGSGKTVFIKCLLGIFEYEDQYLGLDQLRHRHG